MQMTLIIMNSTGKYKITPTRVYFQKEMEIVGVLLALPLTVICVHQRSSTISIFRAVVIT